MGLSARALQLLAFSSSLGIFVDVSLLVLGPHMAILKAYSWLWA